MIKRNSKFSFDSFKLIFLVFFLFLSVLPAYSQKSKNNSQVLIWKQRINFLTDGINEDSSSLTESERAVYLALLAKVLWKTNQTEAEKYLKKSSKLTINSLESDDKPDLAEKLKNTQKTLQVIANLDEKLSRSLLEDFIKILSEKGSDSEKNADTLVLIAIQIVEKNPQTAFLLGLKSLGFGNSAQISRLVGELNVIDSKLAEQLFLAALANAKTRFNLRFIARLSVSAFNNYKGKPLSDLTRRSFLTMLSEFLTLSMTNEQEKSNLCQISMIAAPLIDKFEEYFPAQLPTIKWQMQMCQAYLPKMNQSLVNSDLKDDKPKTVEELISAARNTDDIVLKSDYFYQAMVKLEKEEKYLEILSLLDSMTEDERNSFGNDSFGESVFESSYAQYAYELVLNYVENKDFAAAYKVIDRTPKRVRPSVRIWLAHKLLDKEKDFVIDIVQKAREEADSLEIKPFRRADFFLSLVYIYPKIQPLEAQTVFREAVKFINKADAENPNNLPEKDYAPLKDYLALPAELFENNDIIIFNALSDISSRRSRVRLKLGLLENSLVQYLNEKKKVESKNDNK